mgnify:FL=1|jgi:hypothetical protein
MSRGWGLAAWMDHRMDDQLVGIGRLGREYVVDHQWDIVFRGPKKTRKGVGLSCSENASYIDYGLW